MARRSRRAPRAPRRPSAFNLCVGSAIRSGKSFKQAVDKCKAR